MSDLKRTPQKYVNLIYDILYEFDLFCKRNDIKYSLACGTLLGAIRHNGLIPWDDDADVYIDKGDIHKFLENETELSLRNLKVTGQTYPLWGSYKLFFKDSIPMPEKNNREYTYPSLDIFTIEREDNSSKLSYQSDIAKSLWPNEFIYINEWNNVKEQVFGHLNLSYLNSKDAERYLNDAYGKRWRTHAIKKFDHELEIDLSHEEILIIDFSPAIKK